MQRRNVADRPDFQEDAVLGDQVGQTGAVGADAPVNQRQRDCLPEAQGGVPEFPAEATLLDRFKQAGAERAVDLDAEVNDAAGEIEAWFRVADLCDPCVSVIPARVHGTAPIPLGGRCQPP